MILPRRKGALRHCHADRYASFTVLPLVRGYVARQVRRQVGEMHSVPVSQVLRLIPRTSGLFLWVVAIKAAEALWQLRTSIHRVLTVLVLVVAWLQIEFWAMATASYLVDRQRRRRGEQDTGFASALPMINLEAVHFVLQPKVDALMEGQHGINPGLLRAFESRGIEFAHPTQKVLLDQSSKLAATQQDAVAWRGVKAATLLVTRLPTSWPTEVMPASARYRLMPALIFLQTCGS